MQRLYPVTKSDRSKSLQQLGWQDWGEATYDSHLVKECHRLRRVPLSKFEAEDSRIMIGQNLGMEYLVPLQARSTLVPRTIVAGGVREMVWGVLCCHGWRGVNSPGRCANIQRAECSTSRPVRIAGCKRQLGEAACRR
jgi:hypothetical protein